MTTAARIAILVKQYVAAAPLTFLVLTLVDPVKAQEGRVLPFMSDSVAVEQRVMLDIDGRTDRVVHYYRRQRNLSAAELFFHQQQYRDSVVVEEIELAQDRYTWSDDGQLFSIYRAGRGRSARRTAHLFGPSFSIAIPALHAQIFGRVGETHLVSFFVENRGTDTLRLAWVSLPDNVLPVIPVLTVMPGAVAEVAVHYAIGKGENRTRLLLGHPDGHIPLEVMTRGYDVRTEDLVAGKRFSSPRWLSYFRTGNETLMEACDPRTGEVLLRYPIHGDYSLLDLALPALEIVDLCILDYGLGSRHCALARIVR